MSVVRAGVARARDYLAPAVPAVAEVALPQAPQLVVEAGLPQAPREVVQAER